MPISFTCVVCEDYREEVSGKATLVGTYNDSILFSEVDWENEQCNVVSLVFVVFLSGLEEGEKTVKWWIEDPDGKVWMSEGKNTKKFESDRTPRRMVFLFQPAQFRKKGFHTFRFNVDGKRFKKAVYVGSVESFNEYYDRSS